MFATDLPKKSPLASIGPFVVKSLISSVEFTSPAQQTPQSRTGNGREARILQTIR